MHVRPGTEPESCARQSRSANLPLPVVCDVDDARSEASWNPADIVGQRQRRAQSGPPKLDVDPNAGRAERVSRLQPGSRPPDQHRAATCERSLGACDGDDARRDEVKAARRTDPPPQRFADQRAPAQLARERARTVGLGGCGGGRRTEQPTDRCGRDRDGDRPGAAHRRSAKKRGARRYRHAAPSCAGRRSPSENAHAIVQRLSRPVATACLP